MLGARARAAEYHAFKAASARQASREAEEQKLPPKSAQFSLSAFTKNPHPNRNKGTKAWIPLVLEDTPESTVEYDPEDSEEDPGTLSTPTRQTGGIDPDSASLTKNETPTGPRNLQPVRINLPKLTIPTAPKAMVAANDQPSVIVNPTPKRIQQHSIIRQSQRDAVASVQSSPSNASGMTGSSGFPYQMYPTWPLYLPGMPVLGQFPIPAFNPPQRFRHIMVPSDISPTKQENKLEFLSREYAVSSSTHPEPAQPSSDSSSMGGSSILYPPPYHHYTNMPSLWGQHQYMGAFAQNNFQRPVMLHTGSDSSVPGYGQMSNTIPQPRAAFFRRFTDSDTCETLPDHIIAIDEASTDVVHHEQRHAMVTSVEEPYDRKIKMQSFVAEQQALAKTGKTVLRNPDLHRLRMSEVATPVSPTDSMTMSERESSGSATEGQVGSSSASILRPPPGLESLASRARILEDFEFEDAISPEDEELQKEFNVGTADWFELKPVTKTQRLKMNKTMRFVAGRENPVPSKTGSLCPHADRQADICHWVQNDSRDKQAARTLVDQIAKEHRNHRLSSLSIGDAAVNDQAASVEIESAAISAVGNIWANLTTHRIFDTEIQDLAGTGYSSVWTYKPAPEYAIERGRLLSSSSLSTSFFEEETGGFYNAPSRIARDPRFRPPSKEAHKPKAEEDWKHRHDMYGRRRM